MPVELDGEPAEVTHLGLVMVDPDERGQGLSWVLYGLTALVLFVRDGLRPKWISNVTQVPAVVGMVCETFSDVFPSPHPGARQSFAHLQLARGIMRRHRAVFGVGDEAGFDEARFVITDAYTGGSDALKKTFESAPKHRDPQYKAFCARELDYTRGDDVLQIGRIDLAGARRYLHARSAARFAAGAARRRHGVVAAAAVASGVLLARRYPGLRQLAAAAGRTRWAAAMTPGVIADSIVNLCGAIGLGVAMVMLHRRDPRSPLTKRLLIALGVITLLFFVRGAAWWTGSVLLDRLSVIPAALVPLGALIVTEGILRRHAPRAVKIAIVLGGIGLGLGGVLGLERFTTPFSMLLALFQLAGFAACGWLLAFTGSQHADGIGEPQHRPPSGRRYHRHSLHPHRFPGAGAGYSGQARRLGRAARRHRGPDRGRRRRDPPPGGADDGVAAFKLGVARCGRRLRIA